MNTIEACKQAMITLQNAVQQTVESFQNLRSVHTSLASFSASTSNLGDFVNDTSTSTQESPLMRQFQQISATEAQLRHSIARANVQLAQVLAEAPSETQTNISKDAITNWQPSMSFGQDPNQSQNHASPEPILLSQSLNPQAVAGTLERYSELLVSIIKNKLKVQED